MAGEPTTDVLVIGAGFYGLATAWWLRQIDPTARIVVVDALDFAAGGSGRNGAGFRMQWGLEFNIRLCQETISFLEEAPRRLDYPRGIEMRQDGYLLLAPSAPVIERFRASQELQHSLGVPSTLLAPDDCRHLVPGLVVDGLMGAAYCPKDGSASPFLFLDALLKAVRRVGVEVRFHTRVERLERAGRRFRAVRRDGKIAASKVAVCTDWAAPRLLRPLGIDLPITGQPKEVVVTEPTSVGPGTVLVNYADSLTLRQVARGNWVLAITLPRPDGDDLGSTPPALAANCRAAVALVPPLARCRAIRTWAGVFSKTPDMQAVIGQTELEGVYIAVSAYKGFMTSIAVGRIMAEIMLGGGSRDPAARALHPSRFQGGTRLADPMTV